MNSEVARFEAAMEDALEMRKWIQEHNGKSITEGRLMHQSIKVTGAVPSSIPERIIWFLEHGFEPRSCQELGKLCRMELTSLLETHVRNLGFGMVSRQAPLSLQIHWGCLKQMKYMWGSPAAL